MVKDDIPEEFVSMEWREEHDEDDSESWESKHTTEERGAVRAAASSVPHHVHSRAVETNKLVISSSAAHSTHTCRLWCKHPHGRRLSVTCT